MFLLKKNNLLSEEKSDWGEAKPNAQAKIYGSLVLLARTWSLGGPKIKAKLGETCGGVISFQIKSTQQIISCSSFQIHFDVTARN